MNCHLQADGHFWCFKHISKQSRLFLGNDLYFSIRIVEIDGLEIESNAFSEAAINRSRAESRRGKVVSRVQAIQVRILLGEKFKQGHKID